MAGRFWGGQLREYDQYLLRFWCRSRLHAPPPPHLAPSTLRGGFSVSNKVVLCVCLRAGPRLLQKALSIEPVGPCLSYPPRQRVCFPSNHRVGLCLLRLLDRVLSPLRPLAENSAKWGVPRPWVASLVRTLTTEIQIFLVRLFATFPARPPEGVMNP